MVGIQIPTTRILTMIPWESIGILNSMQSGKKILKQTNLLSGLREKSMLKQQKGKRKNIFSLLREREGASLVLVSIISIIILTGIVILRITTSSLLASADKQFNQDRAYMMAVSMGDSIDKMISRNALSDPKLLNLDDSASTEHAIPNSELKVSVEEFSSGADKYVVITVYSKVADEEYEYKLNYLLVGSTYVRQY